MRNIPFIDLQAQRARLGARIDTAIAKVLEHGKFIMGPEVGLLEEKLGAFCGATHVVSCSSGTDALLLPLMAWGIGPGDAVLVPTFTFIATAEAPALLGATPIFIDATPETFNLDPAGIGPAVEEAHRLGLRPRAIIAVDLFGQPADYAAIEAAAQQHGGLKVLADAAQSFGGAIGDKRVGCFGDATATSFFPAKPLGCYGDGGAVFTDDHDLAEIMRSIRVHGKGHDKYDNVRIGLNGRLDTLQAAVLLEKLAIFPDELEARQRVSERYEEGLGDCIQTPQMGAGVRSAWAQYTLVTNNREPLMADCAAAGIPTQIYYPKPMHRQSGYADYPMAPGGCPIAEKLAAHVFSLPMHPYFEAVDQKYIIAMIKDHFENCSA